MQIDVLGEICICKEVFNYHDRIVTCIIHSKNSVNYHTGIGIENIAPTKLHIATSAIDNLNIPFKMIVVLL